MAGESPLDLMRTAPRRQRGHAARAASRGRLWAVVLSLSIIGALAAGWCGLWFYAAATANSALAGWIQREAAAGRVYSCGSQGASGFPFRIEVRCTDAAAMFNGARPPLTVTAKNITFSAQVYDPTQLVGDITGPLTLAERGQVPRFVATWSLARLRLGGVPPEPDSISVTVDRPRVSQIAGPNAATLFTADHAELSGRIVGGSPTNYPVIDADLRFTAASAPTLQPPLLAQPLQGDIHAVVRGFRDLSPKPWAERFREMQAAAGTIEIKSARVERANITVVGAGKLNVNEHGRLDGLITVAVVGIENLVPALGIDRLIGRGIDRLTGSSGPSAPGLGALDRLLPGLSGVVRTGANASLIDDLKKMGQPTEIDNKPAVLLPLRFSDGSVYLGMIPLGAVPPLF
jgi:hypothetical protein